MCIPQMMSTVCTILPNTNSCPKGTVCCKAKNDGNKKKPKPPPKISERIPPRKPPPSRPRPQGPDLTKVFGTLVNAATGNSDAGSTAAALLPVLAPALGSLLGGGGGGSRPPPPAPPRTPPSPSTNSGGGGGGGGADIASVATSLLPVLAPAFGLGNIFSGGGGGKNPPPRKPPPFRQPLPTPTTTTTTTTTTEKPDDRPNCDDAGTCIAPYLSFTCFGESNGRSPFHFASLELWKRLNFARNFLPFRPAPPLRHPVLHAWKLATPPFPFPSRSDYSSPCSLFLPKKRTTCK